jgi:hypothetical protein
VSGTGLYISMRERRALIEALFVWRLWLRRRYPFALPALHNATRAFHQGIADAL